MQWNNTFQRGKNRLLRTLLSAFIVGGGQVYARRFWAGLVLAIIFYGSIIIMKIIWAGMNIAFWALVTGWLVVWLFNIFDAYKGPRYAKPPCEKSCPAGIAPWIYVHQIATKANWEYPFIPFFKTLGLICPAPCEEKCTRQAIDEPVAIRALKSGVEIGKPNRIQTRRKKHIAVIGAGPCGLTLAYSLTNKGYNVTVYEKEKKPGGVLGTYIPEFRLPSSVLHTEIQVLLNAGFELKCGVEIGKDLSLDELLNNNDLIFIATGAWQLVKLGIPGENNGMVGLEILRRIKNGEKFNLGRVGVVGGGNAAFDVARSLKRFGNEVKIYYRRRIEDMPAEHENRFAAQEEGIEIIPLVTPAAIVKNSVIMARTKCAEGRKGVLEVIKDSEFDVKIDNIVMAIGQKPDTNFLTNFVKIDELGRIQTKNGMTSHSKIFAGGDAVLGAKTIAHAVGHGLSIAEQIDYHIRKIPGLFRSLLKDVYYPSEIKLFKFNNKSRLKILRREPAKRLSDFKPVEQSVARENLIQEASRCLTCPLRYKP